MVKVPRITLSSTVDDSLTVRLSPVFLLFRDEWLTHSFLFGSIALPEPNPRNGYHPDLLYLFYTYFEREWIRTHILAI